jgi:hypothetical protein
MVKKDIEYTSVYRLGFDIFFFTVLFFFLGYGRCIITIFPFFFTRLVGIGFILF